MTIVAIRKKLHHYIETAQDKKVKAIFAMVEDEIEDDAIVWPDKFLNELNKRTSDFENGEVKGRTWEEVKKGAKNKAKSRS